MCEFLSDLDLYDAWRTLHPLDKDYTFFFNPAPGFFQNRLFFSSRAVLDRVVDCTIGIRSLSDHSPISLTISPPYRDPVYRHWRLNPALLSNNNFVEYITTEWQQFIAENDTPGISPSILWESGKAYLRGAIISFTSAQKREALKKQVDLEKTIHNL